MTPLDALFSDPLLILFTAAVIAVGFIVAALFYKFRLMSKNLIAIIAILLGVVGIPVSLWMWSNSFTVLGPVVMGTSVVLLIGTPIFYLFSRFLTTRKQVPKPVAPPTPAAPVGVGKEAPAERIDEDVVRLKVEKTATESALKSLEAAAKEGAISKETFEKHRATYADRLKKIEGELSKRTRVGIAKLEGDIDKVRQSYLEKLKTLSKKALTARPPMAPPKATVEAPRAAPAQVPVQKVPAARAPEPTVKLPEVPSARMEKFLDEETRARPPSIVTASPGVAGSISAAPRAGSSGPTTISDLRREMMDELNRLKRLIGRAEA